MLSAPKFHRPTLGEDGETVIGTLFLTTVISLSVAVFIGAFSAIGYGVSVYTWIVQHKIATQFILTTGALTAFLLYMFDCSYWESRGLVALKRVLFAFTAGCALVGTIFLYSYYPMAPLGLFLVVNPAILWFIRNTVYKVTDSQVFFTRLSYCFMLVTVITGSYWTSWVIDDHWWGPVLKEEYASLMHCADPDNCIIAYLLWASPMIYCMAGTFFALVSIYIGVTLNHWAIYDADEANTQLSKEKRRLRVTVRMFITLIVGALLGMWIAASIAGAQMNLANVVMTFAGMCVVLMSVVTVGALGWDSVRKEVMEIPFIRKLYESFLSDWVKSLFVLTCGPVFLVYLALSVVNQFFRRRSKCARAVKRKIDQDREDGLWVTKSAYNILQVMYTWHWSSVLVKVVWWGVFYVTISIGVGRITTLFLSWLNEQLTGVPLGITTFVFWLVGLVMFLLPPVPGVPVYLTGGVLLVNAASSTYGYTGGIVFTCIVCYGIKLMAIAIQQKGIGQNMSGSLAVRRFVAVNSVTIRAVRVILEQPGLGIDKVFILIGGPDWPTSVLTGILGLRLRDMLFGSLPVIVLIIPCVCASAFLLKADTNIFWGAVSSVTLALAALVQAVAMVLAGYCIEEVAAARYSELEAMEDDQEVLLADKAAEEESARYAKVTRWKSLPLSMKLCLGLSAALMIACVYTYQLFLEQCFVPYALSDTIEGTLGGDPLNIVLPLGYVGLIVFTASCVLLGGFKVWASRRFRDA